MRRGLGRRADWTNGDWAKTPRRLHNAAKTRQIAAIELPGRRCHVDYDFFLRRTRRRALRAALGAAAPGEAADLGAARPRRDRHRLPAAPPGHAVAGRGDPLDAGR